MARLNLNVPQLQLQKRRVPTEEIINVLGQNPLAQGINAATPQIVAGLQKRDELRRSVEENKFLNDIVNGTGDITKPPKGLKSETMLKAQELNAKRLDKLAEIDSIHLLEDNAGAKRGAFGNELRTAHYLYEQAMKSKTPPTSKTPQFVGFDPKGNGIVFDPNDNTLKPAGGVRPGGPLAPRTQDQRPTSSSRTMGEMATSMRAHIPSIKASIDALDAQGKLGVIAGRFEDFMTGKVGADDPEFAALRTNLSLFSSGTLRTHFGARGGQIMYDRIKDIFNQSGQSAGNLKAALDSADDWFKTYEQMGKGTIGSDDIDPHTGETKAQRKARLNLELSNATR